jgi:hypothetical protein
MGKLALLLFCGFSSGLFAQRFGEPRPGIPKTIGYSKSNVRPLETFNPKVTAYYPNFFKVKYANCGAYYRQFPSGRQYRINFEPGTDSFTDYRPMRNDFGSDGVKVLANLHQSQCYLYDWRKDPNFNCDYFFIHP